MATKTAQLYSQTHYLADGTTVNWDFYFDGGYLDKAHVKAYKRSAAGVRTELVVSLSDFITDFRIKVKPAVAAGDTLVIFRDTPKGVPLVDWKSKAVITKEDLAITAAQALFVSAEATDYFGVISDGDLQALAVAAADAAASAQADALAAEASAEAAALSALEAAASADAAAEGLVSLPFFKGSVVPDKHLANASIAPGGGGFGCVLGTPVVTAGAITSIPVIAGGSGFSATTRIALTGGNGNAKAHPVIVGNAVSSIVIDTPGTGYVTGEVGAYVIDGMVVVVAGDSVSTLEPPPSVPGSTLYAEITKQFQRDNPGRNIQFFNRAVGSQTFTTFQTVANSNWPDWYFNHGRDWLPYISELEPDVVIIAFGMNDRENFVIPQLKAAVEKLAILPKVPDLVFVTTAMPSASSATPDISSPVSQTGRDSVAAYVRGYAESSGYGLVDVHRQSRIVRDGIDVRVQSLQEVLNTAVTYPYTLAVPTDDLSISATLASGAWVGGVEVDIGPRGVNSYQFVRVKSSGANIVTSLIDYSIPGSVEVVQKSATLALTPAASSVLTITRRDQRLQVMIDSVVVFDKQCAMLAGQHQPEIRAPGQAGNLVVRVSEYLATAPRLTDADLYGPGLYAGNGLNHPSSIGVAYMFSPVLRATDFTVPAGGVNSSRAGGLTNRYLGFGTAKPLAPVHVTKVPLATPVIPQGNVSNLVVEDSASPGISFITSPTGVSRINCADSTGTARYAWSFVHGSNTYYEAIDGVNIRTVSPTKETRSIPVGIPSKTVAELASVSPNGLPSILFVSNASGGSILAFNDGANWRRSDTRAIVT